MVSLIPGHHPSGGVGIKEVINDGKFKTPVPLVTGLDARSVDIITQSKLNVIQQVSQIGVNSILVSVK
jgi:hypothetical protein